MDFVPASETGCDQAERAFRSRSIQWCSQEVGLLVVLGLIANMAGVIFAFFFGFPQPSHEAGTSIGMPHETVHADGTTELDRRSQTRRRKHFYRFGSLCGLGLMLVGFILQLVGALVPAQ